MILFFLYFRSALGINLSTGSLDVIKDDEIAPVWSPDYTKGYTCHPVSSVYEISSVNSRVFNITTDSSESIRLAVTLAYKTNKLGVLVKLSDNEVSADSPGNITVSYTCKGTGWTEITLGLIYNGKTYPISWVKQCGELNGFDWGLVLLILTAIVVVSLSAYSAKNISALQSHLADESEVLTTNHAIGFVVISSLFLLILFFFMKYVGFVMEIIVCLGGAGAIFSVIQELNIDSYWPAAINFPGVGRINISTIIGLAVSITTVLSYYLTRNWILNNVIGICFAFIIIKTVKIPNFKVGSLLLGLAFFYDIFWVYGSSYIFGDNVMVNVASGLDLPIKLQCPHLSSGSLPFTCSILGLGDLALPGLFLAFASRFDQINSTSYLRVLVLCYSVALGLCIGVLVIFKYPQPALLYISPLLILGMLLYAYKKGEVTKIWKGISTAPLMAYEYDMREIRSSN